MRGRLLFVLLLASAPFACGPPTIVGTADVQGSVSGVAFTSTKAQSIVRTLPASGDPQNGEIMIALGDLACGWVGRSDHLTLDLGGIGVGTYTVVKGYPFLSSLHHDQARAHACRAQSMQTTCDQHVLGGQIVITRYDADASGGVEGTFDVKFVDGEVSGSFQAPRCD